MKRKSKADALRDKRVERLYYARCNGVQIDIMDIGRVFDTGRNAIAANPAITDAALGDAIAAFVQTIRHN